jgi:ATP-dependent Clp protease ATP-binding subunit ClpA
LQLIDLILNSNLGYHHLQGLTSESINDTIRGAVMHEVKMHFRPEFLNRLDDIIIFTPLGRKRKYTCIMYIKNSFMRTLFYNF